MPHPFEKEVIAEADRLEIQIGILMDKRSLNIEKGVDDIDIYIHDKETKLRAIRQHQKNEFKELLHALDREIYCPFCFIFHNHLFKLIPHRKYKNHNLLECTICNATLQKPPVRENVV